MFQSRTNQHDEEEVDQSLAGEHIPLKGGTSARTDGGRRSPAIISDTHHYSNEQHQRGHSSRHYNHLYNDRGKRKYLGLEAEPKENTTLIFPRL